MSKSFTSPSPAFSASIPPSSASSQAARVTPRKLAVGFTIAAVLIAAAFWGARHLSFALSHEETDDAQVEGDISPVLPRVSGFVTRVLVRDNERVEAGQPVIEIDAHELDLKANSAAAALRGAEASVSTARAALANARAGVAVAQADEITAGVTEAKTAADLKRDTALFATNAITDRQVTDSRAASDVARARHEAARRQAEAAATEVQVAEASIAAAQSQIETKRSDLAYAQLERSYAIVAAPIAGQISHKNVELGQFVQLGQTLLSVASDTDVWVVANFKETQLARLRPGQPVDFTVDSYGGTIFHGRVDSIGSATGARFALLPPDNASGNFIKVTQRVPVKIALAAAPDAEHMLRPGMSVTAAVLVKSD